jgi:hypothetical protein
MPSANAPPSVNVPETPRIQRSRRTSTAGRRTAPRESLIGGITNALFSIFKRGDPISISNPAANIAQRHIASLVCRSMPTDGCLRLFTFPMSTMLPFVHIVRIEAKTFHKK